MWIYHKIKMQKKSMQNLMEKITYGYNKFNNNIIIKEDMTIRDDNKV